MPAIVLRVMTFLLPIILGAVGWLGTSTGSKAMDKLPTTASSDDVEKTLREIQEQKKVFGPRVNLVIPSSAEIRDADLVKLQCRVDGVNVEVVVSRSMKDIMMGDGISINGRKSSFSSFESDFKKCLIEVKKENQKKTASGPQIRRT